MEAGKEFLDKVEELTQERIRDKMDNVLPLVPVSYMAKAYFGKSSSWFYQRLNGNMVHGKICRFTDEETRKLSEALRDRGGRRLETAANTIAPR